jgi:hypothetical protein
VTDLGNLAQSHLDNDDSDRDEDFGNSKRKPKLPGVRAQDLGERDYKPEFRVSSVQFSPTGKSFFI